ncbi:hypothetical protein N9F34_01145 [Alphaproteobacteria bacterium]|nr:hypothetical protein [Alphaproteobacteria bacterium]
MILGGDFAMLPAPVFKKLTFNAPTFDEDFLFSIEVGCQRGLVLHTLVLAMVIIVLYEVDD